MDRCAFLRAPIGCRASVTSLVANERIGWAESLGKCNKKGSTLKANADGRPPRGHSFLFTQVWVTGGGGSPGAGVATPEAQRVAAGLELWVNSPCAASFQAYDPFCLLALPAATLMSSVRFVVRSVELSVLI